MLNYIGKLVIYCNMCTRPKISTQNTHKIVFVLFIPSFNLNRLKKPVFYNNNVWNIDVNTIQIIENSYVRHNAHNWGFFFFFFAYPLVRIVLLFNNFSKSRMITNLEKIGFLERFLIEPVEKNIVFASLSYSIFTQFGSLS